MFKSKLHYVFSNNPDVLIMDNFKAVSVISEHITKDCVIKKGGTIFHFRYVDDSLMDREIMDIKAKLPKANVSAFNENLPVNGDGSLVRIFNISGKGMLEITDNSHVPEDKVPDMDSFVMKMITP